MFSSITEAWDKNPVREITNKLKESEKNYTHADLFNLRKDSSVTEESIHLLSTSLDTNLSLSLDQNLASFPSKNYRILPSEKKDSAKVENFDSTETHTFTDSLRESMNHSKCAYHTRHFKKCDQCYQRLKELIDEKVNRKINDVIIDEKLKQLNNLQRSPSEKKTSSDTWKEILIIVSGALIALLLILLIFKTLNK